MATLREEFDAVADELTNFEFVEAKYPITLENAGAYDPVNGSTPGDSQMLKATMLGYKEDQYDGDNIRVGDQKVLIRGAELNIQVIKGVTSFTFDATEAGFGVTTGKVINFKTDPLGITTTLQLRS